MTIKRVKVRARISIGSIIVETPYVTSFNVSVNRGSVPSTFSASLKVHESEIGSSITGTNIKIEAGENSPENTIFVGIVNEAKISPCFDDPSYVILSLQGADILSVLAGKKYTRRCRNTRSTYVTIGGVQRKGHKSGTFKPVGSKPDASMKDDVITGTKQAVGLTDVFPECTAIKKSDLGGETLATNVTIESS